VIDKLNQLIAYVDEALVGLEKQAPAKESPEEAATDNSEKTASAVIPEDNSLSFSKAAEEDESQSSAHGEAEENLRSWYAN